ncbi:MAG: hypothetical protein ABI673_11425 [Novosphingobium sp.]
MADSSRTLWSIQYLCAFAAPGVILFRSLSSTAYEFEFGSVGLRPMPAAQDRAPGA